jgi:hypothetical protein
VSRLLRIVSARWRAASCSIGGGASLRTTDATCGGCAPAVVPPLSFCNTLCRYGLFSGLMLFGSCVGIATWSMYLQWNTNVSKANYLLLDWPSRTNEQKAQALTFFARFAFWRAAFSVTYAVEFLCLSVAKLMVLDRMSGFLSLDRQRVDASRRWAVGRRFVVAVVVAGNLVGLAGNVAAAVQWQPTVELWTAASAEWTMNNTDTADSIGRQGTAHNKRAISTLSVQAFSEVAVLLLIIAAFSVVGIACFRRIGSFLSVVGAAEAAVAEGRQLQLQIVATSAVVFVTFLVRSVYSTMYALAVGLQNFDSPLKSCSEPTNLCNSACYNVFAQMEVWMKRTPEFVLMIVLTTKPLPLLVALWGMTSKRLLTHMRPNQRELAGQGSRLRGLLPSSRSSV